LLCGLLGLSIFTAESKRKENWDFVKYWAHPHFGIVQKTIPRISNSVGIAMLIALPNGELTLME